MTSLESALQTAKTNLPVLTKKRDLIQAQITDAENTITTLEKAGVSVPALSAPAAPVSEQH